MSTISDSKNHAHQKLTAAGLLISLGIIYGDIGTSPLYVMKAIAGDRVVSEALILETTQQFLGEIDQKPPVFSAIKKDKKQLF